MGTRWLTTLCAALLTWLSAAGIATAERPALPSPMPTGYTVEARGDVRWIYPNSASDEAGALMQAQPEAWRRLERDFGRELPDTLDIRVAINPGDMRRLAGRALPSYASGVALVEEGLILLSLTAPDTWLRPNMEALLVHELSHVALHRAVGDRRVPRWFTEGVAIHQAGERNLSRIRTLWEGTVQRRLLRVEQLSGAFPRDHHGVDLAYAQSADIVRYMLDGRDERARFRRLIGLLHDGVEFGSAVQQAYHVSLGYLEREWRSQIQRRYGRWPSILIGLTGVWSLGALLLLAGYIRARRRHRRTLNRWAVQEAEEDRAMEDVAAGQQVAAAAGDGPRVVQVVDGSAARQEAATSPVDRVLDRALRERDSEIPTVDHDGRSHTLH